MDYSTTLNLPRTDFPMKAGLPKKEPQVYEHWEKTEVYRKMREKRKGAPRFILHDGPPYANGSIHMGTALNKVLKDIINKYKYMRGYDIHYVPGWDTHILLNSRSVTSSLLIFLLLITWCSMGRPCVSHPGT